MLISDMSVSFGDEAETAINAYFGVNNPQSDNPSFPYQGTVDTSDARWKTYYDGFPSFMQWGMPVPTDADGNPLENP